jgi:hypothetical protein
MSIIAIKTYYDTIKTVIFIQVYYMHYENAYFYSSILYALCLSMYIMSIILW